METTIIETSEVIAEIITFSELQSKLKKNTIDSLNKQIADLLAIGGDQSDQISKLIAGTNQTALQLASNLPRYSLFVDDNQSYLVLLPKIETRQAKTAGGIGSTDKNKYPHPFNIGDNIYLINKEGTRKSQVYQITLASLVGNDDHEPIKASKAVLEFMVNQLGTQIPDNFKGYPGTSFSMWRKVQQ